MPLLWPKDPSFANATERRVWEALRDQLGENDLLISNVRLNDRQRDYEVDHAIVFHDAGVVVVETKGGRIWKDGSQWMQGRADGSAVRLEACSHEEALERADDVVDELLGQGWKPSDIAVLATGPRHPEQTNRQADGQSAYWDSFWDEEQVFYGHVLGFKGLERSVIVLAVNEQPGRDRAKERLYVGLSRARNLLVVCGDPQHLKDVGGPSMLKKMGVDG